MLTTQVMPGTVARRWSEARIIDALDAGAQGCADELDRPILDRRLVDGTGQICRFRCSDADHAAAAARAARISATT
jgi:hypothetical protein